MLKKIRKYEFYWFLKVGFTGMFFLQFLYLAVLNLTQMQYHIGFDGSSFYLKAMEMAKQRTIFIDDWVNQTTLYLDSPVPIAAVIYAITGNIFFSYGIANTIISIAFFYVFYSILSLLSISNTAKMICLNMIACTYISPLLSNAYDLGYTFSMLAVESAYILKVTIVLMLIKTIMELEENKVCYGYIIATEILLFISGISSGWYLLVTAILPIIVHYIFKMFRRNSYKEIFNKSMLILIISGISVAMGKCIAVNKLDFVSRDSGMVLVGLTDFWKNIGSIILGFMELVTALPHYSDQNVLKIEGIIYLMGTFVFFLCVLGFIVVGKKSCENFCLLGKHGILVSVIGFNLLMYTILYTTYGSEIFESRYLIPIFLMLVIMVGEFIDGIDNTLILKKIGIILIFVVYITLNVFDDTLLYKTKNNYDILASVAEEVAKADTQVVYIVGETLSVDGRNLRVVDKERVYKNISENSLNRIVHWGDYTYFDDVADAPGRNVIVTTKEYYATFPKYIKNNYNLQAKIDKYAIYVAEKNRFDLKTGIDDDYGMDYPTSAGFSVSKGIIDGTGSFMSSGESEGYIIWGPYTSIKAGNYDFILNYEVLKSSKRTAEFVVSLDLGNSVLGSMVLNKEKKQAIINIEFSKDCDGLEYKVFNYRGTKIRIDSFEIVKK